MQPFSFETKGGGGGNKVSFSPSFRPAPAA